MDGDVATEVAPPVVHGAPAEPCATVEPSTILPAPPAVVSMATASPAAAAVVEPDSATGDAAASPTPPVAPPVPTASLAASPVTNGCSEMAALSTNSTPVSESSPSKSRRKQELVARQVDEPEILLGPQIDEAAKQLHRRKQPSPKRKLMESPTRLIARHKRVKLHEVEKVKRKLKLVTKSAEYAVDPSANWAESEPGSVVNSDTASVKAARRQKRAASSEASDGRAADIVDIVDEAASVDEVSVSDPQPCGDGVLPTSVDVNSEHDTRQSRRVSRSESTEQHTPAAPGVNDVDGSVAAGTSNLSPSKPPSSEASPSKKSTNGSPRKVLSSKPNTNSPRKSPTVTGVVRKPVVPGAARKAPGPSTGVGAKAKRRRRKRRPATGFVTARKALVKRRPAGIVKNKGVVNGQQVSPRSPRKKRSLGDLSIDMKEPFALSPSKTRSRLRSLTAEPPQTSPRRSSREPRVNGAAPSAAGDGGAAADAAAADGVSPGSEAVPEASPDGSTRPDWEAKFRSWNDDGSKKCWAITPETSSNADQAPDTRPADGTALPTSSLDIKPEKDSHSAAPPIANSKDPTPATPTTRRRRPAAPRRRGGRGGAASSTPRGRGARAAASKRDTDRSGVETPSSRRQEQSRGPYLLVSASTSDVRSTRVVNCAGDVTGPEARRLPAIHCELENIPNQPKIGFSSAYSKNYDAFTVDPTWLCVFCRRRSHEARLGDLLGPCFVVRRDEVEEVNGGSAKPPPGKPRRRGKQKEVTQEPAAPPPAPAGSGLQPGFTSCRLGDRLETWFHEGCLAWSPEVHLTAAGLQGVQEAVTASRTELCSVCDHVGATVGCLGRGCRKGFHLPCAEQAGCQLDQEALTAYCAAHRKPD